ncbi:MAG: hypothetical protein K6C05_01555 [Anaerovibrio sp.]|uniref:hypothetical protein n=1 Tax=Anaerovibrio sp. TaxID=1872532 RepID=UPI0025DA2D65|nr:hypothetical protein [Anaerovibrio sp.]MCR5175516.1 hypothetical protein [Anaerovibrio sp.]
MKAAVSLSHPHMGYMQRAFMPVNTHHYSFLEGKDFHYSKEDDVSYRMFIHKLRIGTFTALVGACALALCL